MFKRLKRRFIVLHMGIVTLIILLFFGSLLAASYQNMQKRADEMLDRTTSVFSVLPKNGLPQPGRPEAPRFSPIFTVRLTGEGQIASVASSFDVEEDFYRAVTSIALAKKSSRGTIHYDGGDYRYRTEGTTVSFLDISKETALFSSTLYAFLWIALPLLALIFLISLYFANRSVRPVEQAYNRQKEFIADASHELKTPLSVISANVDMLMENAGEEDRKWLSYIRCEASRMSDLTMSLLYLTRLDSRETQNAAAVLDFSALTEHCLLPLEAVFYENAIKAEVHIQPGLRVLGDSEQLRRLVAALLDNAVKYSDGYICVSLTGGEHGARLMVYNTGKGIAKEDLPKIWNRFYRCDKARQRSGGFGLGLPIANAIAERHGGTITVESRENEWTRFTLKLPQAKK